MSRRAIIFKAIASHATLLKPDQKKYELFGESELDEESILELEEKDIIRWLFNQKDIISWITNEFLEEYIINIGYECFVEIKEPILSKSDQNKIGDIDILIVPSKRPDYATVIEVKRVKLQALEDGTVKMNKFERARSKGYKQVKELSKFRFHRTILCIIIEDDAREVKTQGTIVRASESEEVEWIFSMSLDRKLPKEIGVGYIIVNQPTGENYNQRSNIKFLLEKRPYPVQQATEKTKRIIELLGNPPA